MLKSVRHKQSFNATDDQGHSHKLHVFVDIIDASTRDDPHAEEEGLKSIRTGDGSAVNYLEKGKYQIVSTGQMLSSNDPNAL
ncbi:MAG TPA: hypothetical protein VHS31_05355 [Tepidisphaeraceae bacterium]|jgi:hypothetical protein|nr:hypothetical protein [Tepidisphaeraceae bacterium]